MFIFRWRGDAMTGDNYRHEFKYLATMRALKQLELRLNGVVERDSHVMDTGRYLIRSIYFDDINTILSTSSTIPTFRSEIIFYAYILICLINIIVIFFCFYFYIRRQYSYDTKVFKKHPSKKIIDDDFIEEQKTKEEDYDMNEGIITQKPLNRKKSSLDFNEIVITKHHFYSIACQLSRIGRSSG